jgi:hypothetical protein
VSSVKRDWKLAKAWLNPVLPTALPHDSDRFHRNGPCASPPLGAAVEPHRDDSDGFRPRAGPGRTSTRRIPRFPLLAQP